MNCTNFFKQLTFITLFTIGFATVLSAQFTIGLKGGLSSDNFKKDQFDVEDENSNSKFTLGLKDAEYGYHFGGFVRIGGKFFVQPEMIFNSSSTNYTFESLSLNEGAKDIFTETNRRIDVPFIFGYKLGNVFNIQAGPVGHFHINSASELTDIQGYKEKFDTFTYGYQAGVGVEFWKVLVHLRYEGNFNKNGEHITFFNRNYNFDSSPSRLMLSVGLRL